jgi:hypothetical protein
MNDKVGGYGRYAEGRAEGRVKNEQDHCKARGRFLEDCLGKGNEESSWRDANGVSWSREEWKEGLGWGRRQKSHATTFVGQFGWHLFRIIRSTRLRHPIPVQTG